VSSFKVEASMDEENWLPLVIKEGIREWLPGEAKIFTCQIVRAFRFYRLTVLKTTDKDYSGVALCYL